MDRRHPLLKFTPNAPQHRVTADLRREESEAEGRPERGLELARDHQRKRLVVIFNLGRAVLVDLGLYFLLSLPSCLFELGEQILVVPVFSFRKTLNPSRHLGSRVEEGSQLGDRHEPLPLHVGYLCGDKTDIG